MARSAAMGGHLFIINGDLNKVACDAILIPTDSYYNIEPQWKVVPKRMVEKKVPSDWGSQHVMKLSYRPKERQIWLGNIGQDDNGSDFEDFKPAVVAFVEQASKEIKAIDPVDRVYQWPIPRLAVNVVGSGEGGGSDIKGDLVEGLVTTLEMLAAHEEADIILVTFGEKPYAAAQRIRRDMMKGKPLTKTWQFDKRANRKLVARARDLAKHAIDSQLVLFIGAGVSAGAGAPTWDKLLREVAHEANLTGNVVDRLMNKDPRDRATILERRLESSQGLKTMVARRLDRSKLYALAHGLLASLPSKEAVTTNFDTLFEAASAIDNRKLAVLPDDPRAANGRWLLKLHGTVTKPEKMVLTRFDFLNMPRRYGALMGLVQGLLMMRHLMFVGYSLRDEDFHELIHEVRTARGDNAAKIGRGTVLTLWDDELEEELWIDDLKIVPIMSSAPPEVGPEEREVADREAGRQLEIFLDLVGYLSTTSAAFFLDKTYRTLAEGEKELLGPLTKLIELTNGAEHDEVAYKIRQFLERELGAGKSTRNKG